MLGSGNGRPERCAMNLLLCKRGEVPFSRLKGLTNRLIDMPSDQYTPEMNADVTWLMGRFEPRAEAGRLAHEALNNNGDFAASLPVVSMEG